MAGKTKQRQPWTAESWNAAHPVGTRVRYWPVLPPTESTPPLDTTTRSEAWELGDGTAVVKIVGRTGGVHLAHLVEVERQSDAACATIAELVTALTGLERRFLDPTASDPGGSCWCSEDRPRWMDHEDCCDVARGALAKAKGGGT